MSEELAEAITDGSLDAVLVPARTPTLAAAAPRAAGSQPALTPGTQPALTPAEVAEKAAALEHEPPEAILAWAVATFHPHLALACSFGVEDMVLLDLLADVQPGSHVFYLDTGLLFPETYALRDEAVLRYPLQFEQVVPELTVDEQGAAYGQRLWERTPDLCCGLRKVEPLQHTLRRYQAWITGIRRAQSPTRAGTAVVEWDARFGLVKINPLATLADDEVWAYVRERDIPYNPLHDRGYPSIGCWPCTRAVRPDEDPRAGRWAGFDKTECGLHPGHRPTGGRCRSCQ